ncbi:FHA domain-containing protein [Actinocorallia longicatena]|uniref:FHA domain-containing protein n=1 Tax=Actinocorallia longicatena TaxID=111803 RepID=A0ABP6PYK7_9ACTN
MNQAVSNGTGAVVRPLRGEGIVARQNGLLMVCDGTDADAEKLLGVLNEVAARGGSGRDLAHRVALVLSSNMSEQHACAVAGPVQGGVAVLVSGAATAMVTGPGGEVRLDGRDALTWTDRFIGGRVDQVELRLPGAGGSDTRWRLDSGIVPGGGLQCLFAPMHPPAAHGHGHGHGHEVEGPTARAPQNVEGPTGRPDAPPRIGDAPVDLRPRRPQVVANVTLAEDIREQPFESVLLIPSEQPPAPAPPAAAPMPDSRPLVWGADCKNGHFNDPRVQYCGVCGIAMVQMSLIPRQSARPPLGVLLLDDGMTLRLDTDYVIGRSPEPAPEVVAGRARPVRLTDAEGSVSRRHIKISLNQWDVQLTDLGSVNGTFLKEPDMPQRQLQRGETVMVPPGSVIQVGAQRSFRYESNRKR